jgi:hypothetical protein
MRSEIIIEALEKQNAFALCHRTFKLIRKSHKPSARIQETATVVLQQINEVEQKASSHPENVNTVAAPDEKQG